MTSPVNAGVTWTLDLPRNAWRARGHANVPAVFVDPIPNSRMQFADLSALTSGGVVTPPADTFVLGTTKPSAANTGQAGYAAIVGAPAAARTVVNGDVTLSTPGQVYENKTVVGFIYVRAANVTIRNCAVTNRTTAFVTGGLINVDSAAASNFLIEFCDVYQTPNTACFWLNGIRHQGGAKGMVRRCNIRDTADGINCGDASGGVIRTQGNYIHHRAFFNNSTDHSSDAVHPFWEHMDAVQLSGGSGHYFDGDYYEASISTTVGTIGNSDYNLAVSTVWGTGFTASPDKGPISNLTITRCWFEYGQASFQMNSANGGVTNVGTFSGCRFGMGQFDYGGGSRYQIRYNTGLVFLQELTNYFDPDAPTVPTAKKGNLFAVGFTGGIRRN